VAKLAAILNQTDSGSLSLPEIQPGSLWNCHQVRGLMRSLYLGYPVGSLLTWETLADGSLVCVEAAATPALRVLQIPLLRSPLSLAAREAWGTKYWLSGIMHCIASR
jgi:hypothetical protein